MLEIQEFKHKHRLIVFQMRQRYKSSRCLQLSETVLQMSFHFIQELP